MATEITYGDMALITSEQFIYNEFGSDSHLKIRFKDYDEIELSDSCILWAEMAKDMGYTAVTSNDIYDYLVKIINK